MRRRNSAGQALGLALVAELIATTAAGAEPSVVRYRLGLGGGGNPPEQGYVHGDEGSGHVFDPAVTPFIRWDAVVEVTGPNQGAANLVFDLEVRSGSPDGPIVTEAVFSGDSADGRGANFSGCLPAGPGVWQAVNAPVAEGGADLAFASTGTPLPGQLLEVGAGYMSWNNPGEVKAGIGRATLPAGNPGLGQNPTFDGRIDISRLAPGTYYLVLRQPGGVNVLRDDFDPSQPTSHFARHADETPGASISFVIGPDANGNPHGTPNDGNPSQGSEPGSPADGVGDPPPGPDGNEAGTGLEPGQSDEEPHSPGPPICGAGVAHMALFMWFGLMAVGQWRHRRRY